MHVLTWRTYTILSEKLRDKDHFGGTAVDARKTLKWFLKMGCNGVDLIFVQDSVHVRDLFNMLTSLRVVKKQLKLLASRGTNTFTKRNISAWSWLIYDASYCWRTNLHTGHVIRRHLCAVWSAPVDKPFSSVTVISNALIFETYPVRILPWTRVPACQPQCLQPNACTISISSLLPLPNYYMNFKTIHHFI
jgi:hypothetical protein